MYYMKETRKRGENRCDLYIHTYTVLYLRLGSVVSLERRTQFHISERIACVMTERGEIDHIVQMLFNKKIFYFSFIRRCAAEYNLIHAKAISCDATRYAPFHLMGVVNFEYFFVFFMK